MIKPSDNIVFICSPYAGAVAWNTVFAENACRYAIAQGRIPFAPHLLFPRFLDDSDPDARAEGLEMGMAFLPCCTELWLCGPMVTKGMALEIGWAKAIGIPVRNVSAEVIQKWAESEGGPGA